MREPPRLLRVAAAIEALEGLALVGYATYFLLETLIGAAGDTTSAVALTAVTALLGLGALVAARGLHRGRRWSRAPAVATQIFALPVAVTFFQSGRPEIGAPLAVAAVAALVALFHPTTTHTLSERELDASWGPRKRAQQAPRRQDTP